MALDSVCERGQSSCQLEIMVKKIIVKFGERTRAIYFNESGCLQVDPASVAVNARAEQIARTESVSFGEALMRARRETPELAGAQPHFDNRWVEIEFVNDAAAQTR